MFNEINVYLYIDQGVKLLSRSDYDTPLSLANTGYCRCGRLIHKPYWPRLDIQYYIDMWVVFWHPAYMLEDRGRKTQHRGLKLIRNDIKIKGAGKLKHTGLKLMRKYIKIKGAGKLRHTGLKLMRNDIKMRLSS